MTMTPHLASRTRSPAIGGRIAALTSLTALGLLLSTSQLVAQSATATSTTAAEDDKAVLLDEYVVAGVRGSMIRAQEIKQNSITLVDSIVAEDIGKLPDNTVADAPPPPVEPPGEG